MKSRSLWNAALLVLAVSSHAVAELRVVLVKMKQDKDENVSVSICSDVAAERKANTSLDDAIKTIGGMKGWGSAVNVYLVADHGARGRPK